MSDATKILVTGAGGFIGHHLVTRLKAQGHWVRGVDLKRPWLSAPARRVFSVRQVSVGDLGVGWQARRPDDRVQPASLVKLQTVAVDKDGVRLVGGQAAELAIDQTEAPHHVLD